MYNFSIFILLIIILILSIFYKYKYQIKIKESFDISKIKINQNKDNLKVIKQKVDLLNKNTFAILNKSKDIAIKNNSNNILYQKIKNKYQPYLGNINSQVNIDVMDYEEFNEIKLEDDDILKILTKINKTNPNLIKQVYPQYINARYTENNLNQSRNYLDNM